MFLQAKRFLIIKERTHNNNLKSNFYLYEMSSFIYFYIAQKHKKKKSLSPFMKIIHKQLNKVCNTNTVYKFDVKIYNNFTK